MTLVELMVALVIVSIAIAATFALGFSMMNSYRDHGRAMQVEQAARVSLEIIGDALRASSPGVPSGHIVDLNECYFSAGPPIVRLENALNSTGGTGTDAIIAYHASGGVLTSTANVFNCNGGCTSNSVAVQDVEGFAVGDSVILSNFNQGYFLEISGVDDSTNTLTFGAATGPCPALTQDFPIGSLVIRARSSVFFIDNDVLFVHNTPAQYLNGNLVGAEPIAMGIEDLQVAIAIDDGQGGFPTDDGLIGEVNVAADDDEWRYNTVGDTAPTALSVSTNKWRAMRVSVVARSLEREEVRANQQVSSKRNLENHIFAAPPDGFKRRTLTTVVEFRNLEGSP